MLPPLNTNFQPSVRFDPALARHKALINQNLGMENKLGQMKINATQQSMKEGPMTVVDIPNIGKARMPAAYAEKLMNEIHADSSLTSDEKTTVNLGGKRVTLPKKELILSYLRTHKGQIIPEEYGLEATKGRVGDKDVFFQTSKSGKPNVIGGIVPPSGNQRLYETTEGWQPASEAVGLQKTGETGGKDPVFKQKIDQLMKTHGLSEREATDIVEGIVDIMVDPVSGEKSIVDLVSGTQRPLKATEKQEGIAEGQAEGKAPPAKTIWELSELSTGPLSAIKSAGSVVSGMVGGPIAEETIQARQLVKAAQNNLIRSLSINPRFPVAEINRIKSEIDIEPKIFDTPAVLRERLKAIDSYLTNYVRMEKVAANDRSLPVDVRKEARRSVYEIENFIDLLGVPSGGGVPTIKTQEEYDKLSVGDKYIDSETGQEYVRGNK